MTRSTCYHQPEDHGKILKRLDYLKLAAAYNAVEQHRDNLGRNVKRQNDQEDGQAEKPCARNSYDLYCFVIFFTKY